jgi:hypothetical protein
MNKLPYKHKLELCRDYGCKKLKTRTYLAYEQVKHLTMYSWLQRKILQSLSVSFNLNLVNIVINNVYYIQMP